jgi:ABC-type polysaccharide/polyol phosphate transport system ATPase subunit
MEHCDQATWLDHGEVMKSGKICSVFDAYESHAALAAEVQTQRASPITHRNTP